MNSKIKKPKTKGVAKVPFVMQLEALECGAASLTMILAYYRKWIPLEQVRLDCGVSRDGANAKNIMIAARHYGLNSKAFRYEPEEIKQNGVFPCIIHWNFNHFVVLDGFRGNKAYLNDPAKGSYSVSMEAFDKAFTGICLQFTPEDNFKPEGKPKKILPFVFKSLKGSGSALVFTALSAVIAAMISFISPAFSRIFIDRILPGNNSSWVNPFIALLFVFDLIQILMSAFKSVFGLRINGKMAASGNASYMWKVLRMPMVFFSQRMSGDIQRRQDSYASVANTAINTVVPLLLDVVLILFYLLVMIRYSLVLTVVGLVSIAINSFSSRYISKKRINITRASMRDAAKLSATTVSGIEMIETIKSAGAENGFFAKWAGYQASVNNNQMKTVKVSQYLGLIPQFFTAVSDSITLILGVFLVMKGKFSIGMVMAFQGFLNSFMAPANDLISLGQTLQEMRTSMERIEDVMEYPDDNIFAAENEDNEETYKLSGNIEIKNLTFGYSPLAQPFIKDFCLSVKQGETIAIVGQSGCGKSTISKLISGLYKPWSGEILFDGKPLSEITPSIFHGSVAVVDQEIVLFEDTIANNIKMWDDSIEDFEMILACRDAQLHYDIMERPEGYNYKIIEGGKNFSGGQCQRMEIARVLAQDPTILILDEATSALDAKTEYEVIKAIKERGITCIVVAHRLSTIRNSDQIIVLQNGIAVDRGTHKTLMETSDLYKELVTAE